MSTTVTKTGNEELLLTQKVIKLLRVILWCAGIDIFDSQWKRRIGRLYTVFIIIFYHLYFPNNIYFLYKSWNNFLQFTNALAILSSSTQNGIKYWEIIFWRKEINQLFALKEEAFHKSLLNEKHHEISLSYVKFGKKFLMSIFWLYVVDVILLSMAPVIFQDKSVLPLFCYFPLLPHDISPYYEINYFHHVGVLVIIICVTFNTDSFLVVGCLQACALIEVIKYDMSLLGTKEVQLQGYKSDKELLRRCYMMHLEVIEYVKLLQRVYNRISLAHFLTSIITFSMLANVFATSLANSSWGYFIAVLFQTFIYCYFGNLLVIKSDNILADMYDNQWYELDISDRQSLIIMMTYAQQPLVLKAGGIADLSLVNFVSIVKTAYSYFAVVQSKK